MAVADRPTTAPDLATGQRVLGHKWLVFTIVAFALMMASIDQTIVATALPAIQHDLDATVNWSSWTITIYALGQVVVMPLAGRLSDQFGRKTIFVISLVLFTAASLACGLANDIYTLVALRAVQAVGGGAFMPSASGIVADHFGPDRDRAIGMFSSIFPIGGIIGPIIGGVFVSVWSWRAIFLVNVPVGVAVLLMTLRYIPETGTRTSRHTDFRGILLLGSSLLVAMFSISYLGSSGHSVDSPVFLISVLAAVVLVAAFVRHSAVDPDAFIPVRFLTGRGFGAVNLYNFTFGSAALGFGALVPLYAEDRYRISSLSAGTLLTARAVGMICVAGLAVMALRRTGYRVPLVVGSIVVAAGLAMMWLPPRGLSDWAWLALAAAISGLGMGFSVPASNNASMQLAPDEIAAISGLRGMFRQSGAIVAVSVTTAVLARSSDPGRTLGDVFGVFAIITICLIPLVFLIPNHRGRW